MPVTTPPTRVSLPIVLRRLTVLRAVDVTPRMRRITLTGDQLGAFRAGEWDAPAFTTEGADDYVKIFLPEPGSDMPVLPEQHDGHLHWPRKPAPVARAYTVRRFDSEAVELDLDFVLHGHGPAGDWARTAAPGDVIHLAGPKISTVPPEGADWWVLAGDETALPAMGRFVDEYAGSAPLHVFVLVDDATEEQSDLADVTWVHRVEGRPDAEVLAEAVDAGAPRGGDGWMWIAGEAAIVRELRAVSKRLGVPKPMLHASGYWRSPESDRPLARLRLLKEQAVETLEARRRGTT